MNVLSGRLSRSVDRARELNSRCQELDDDEQAESRAVLAESEADKASTEDRIEDSQNRHD